MTGSQTACSVCGDWPIIADDRFCGGCGAFVAPVRFEWRLEQADGQTKLGLKAALLRRAEPVEEPDGLGSMRFAVSHGLDGDAHGRVFDLGQVLKAGVLPLVDETRVLKAGVADIFAVRAVRGRRDQGAPVLAEAPILVLARGAREPKLSVVEPDVQALERLELAVANDGGPVAVRAARLRLDGIEPSEHEVAFPIPRIFTSDAPVKVNLDLPLSWDAGLKQTSVPLDGELELIDVLGGVLSAGPLSLSRPGPASGSAEIAPSAAALQGRRARLAARLRNTGGQGLRATRVVLALKGAEDRTSTELPLPSEWRHELSRGQASDVELRPWLTVTGVEDGDPLPPGDYEATLVVDAVDRLGEEVEVEAAAGRLRIRAPAPLDGRLCIDFGTTESGAAVWLGRIEKVDTDEGLEPPQPLELGRVGFAAKGPGMGDRFLPTAVLNAADGDLYGDEAVVRSRLRRPDDTFLVNFKWRLDDEQSLAAAAGYLRHVRERIEEHPSIAALVTAGTPVFATRPAEFADSQAEALARAFELAGFGEPRTTIFSADGARTLIYESWSPLILALFADEKSSAPLDAVKLTAEEFLLPGEAGTESHVIVCDVGGGSADFSVLKVEEASEEDGDRRITEVYKKTDREFVGLRFRDLIKRELIRFIEGKNLRPADEAESEDLWDAAVTAIQHAPGLLSHDAFDTAFRDYFSAQGDSTSQLGSLFGVGDAGNDAAARQVRRAMTPYLKRLKLPLAGGETLLVRFDDLPELLSELQSTFRTAYLSRLREITEGLMAASGLDEVVEAGDRARGSMVRIIPSGRGAAFPMAFALISAMFGPIRALGAQITNLTPLAGKSITSFGGLFMANYADLSGDVSFDLGRTRRRYWLVTGVSTRKNAPKTKRREFAAMGELACLSCAELSPKVLRKPLRIEASWDDPRGFDPVDKIELPADVAPERLWLVARRDGEADRVALFVADTAEEAVAAPEWRPSK